MDTKIKAVSVIFLLLSVSACTPSGTEPNETTPNKSAEASPTSPGVHATILPIDPQNADTFFEKSGIKAENMENKAVLVDPKTVALSLTGSSSCPSAPETITILDDELNIVLKKMPDECTADLTTSYWEIVLPPVLIPRTTPLNVNIASQKGIRLNLVALPAE